MKSNFLDVLNEYDFLLPEEHIARYPLPQRQDSRLLAVQGNVLHDKKMSSLPDVLKKGDLLVFNNTKVMKARIHTYRKTGGAVEVFVTKILDDQNCCALIRPSRKIKEGEQFVLGDGYELQCVSRNTDQWHLRCLPSVQEIMDTYGEIPIPPYFKREATAEDEIRYQSIFADKLGAVAASTASLHIDAELQEKITNRGIDIATLTLHIGMGTFAPLREEHIQTKKLHREWFSLEEKTIRKIQATKTSGGRVIAVGTTVARCLESVAQDGELCAKSGETEIFIQEGFSFRVMDGLLTNFHLPQSSLLMLVCAFGGKETILRAYQHAIKENYRFYSYGDAMLILPDHK